MKNPKLFVLVLVMFTGSLSAQNPKHSSFNPNQFELSLSGGYSLNRVNTQLGETVLINNYSPGYGMMLYYKRMLNDKFSLIAGWGFGFQSHGFIQKPSSRNFVWPFIERIDAGYNIYHKLQVGGAYKMPLKNNWSLEFDLAGGIMQHSGTGYGYGGFDDDFNRVDYLHFKYSTDIVPVVTVGASAIEVLKNFNELKFGISYSQCFGNSYNGDFDLTTLGSYGTLNGTGSSLDLKLGYVFTGWEKKEKISKLVDDGKDIKNAKKQIKKEQRYINPRSTFVSLLGGLGIGMNLVENSDGFIVNGGFPSGTSGINVEQGIKNNLFVEAGYHFIEYQDVTRVKFEHTTTFSTSSFGTNAFGSHEFSLGGGYRLISKNNYPFFNVHLGLIGGFTAEDLGIIGGGSSGGSIVTLEGTTYSFNLINTDEILSKFVCGAYAGISKDFRILNNFYLCFNYRYQQGFNNIERSYLTYTSSDFEGIRRAIKNINGTAHFIQFGIKFKVGELNTDKI